ncbi:MAG: carboxypeptidase regulatory-like domain-containing protein, partial [Terriglobia bacterium]
MLKNLRSYLLGSFVVCFALGSLAAPAWGQTGSVGTVSITVLDQSGALVPGAQLQLQDLATNDVRNAATQNNGTYGFFNLPFGRYELTVTKAGFATQVYSSVTVQTNQVTDLKVTLKVGSTAQKIEVSGGATPLLQTTSDVISTTIDTKQVQDLPLDGRDVTPLAFLVPGWASYTYSGSFDNLPAGALGANVDGTFTNSNRFKSGGFGNALSMRLEDVSQMTVQTAHIPLNQGSGQNVMQIDFATRRGSNQIHGNAYEDFRNVALNANSWNNNAIGLPKGPFLLNDFGVSAGGPIIKNKLFIFGTYAESIQPQTNTGSASIMTPAAQQGMFTYLDANGTPQTLNVFSIAQSGGLPTAINPSIASQLQTINGTLKYGVLSPTSDPNAQTLSWQQHAEQKNYFPDIRVDYNISSTLRTDVAWSEEKDDANSVLVPTFPAQGGPPFSQNVDSNRNNNYTLSYGLDWTARPTLLNQFHFGYLHNYGAGAVEASGLDPTVQKLEYWGNWTSEFTPPDPYLATSSLLPVLNSSDTLTWQHGAHTFEFGGSWFRENDHYWNPPGGWPAIGLGFSGPDPAGAVFSNALSNLTPNQINEAGQLYAVLTGRVDYVAIAGSGRPVDPKTKTYKPYGVFNLDEMFSGAGLFGQDSWRVRPNLTVNYGLRWDFVGDSQNVDGVYSSPTTPADLWGPSGVGNEFNPGSLKGPLNPTFTARKQAYNPSYLNAQPQLGIAWNPRAKSGFLGKLMGGDKTMIRAGYSLRNYTEGGQNFWTYASNFGAFFFQQGGLTFTSSPGLGNVAPGTLCLGDQFPPYFLNPPSYATVNPEAVAT